MSISILLAIALVDNSPLVGQASSSSKSIDLTSQDKVAIKLTPSGTTAMADVSPKDIKIKEGTTVVWQNMLPEKVYVQSKADENHNEGELLNGTYIFPGESREETLSEPASFIYDGSNGFGSYYVRGAITVVEVPTEETEISIETSEDNTFESPNLGDDQFFEDSDANVSDTDTSSSSIGSEIVLLSQKLKKESFGGRNVVGQVKNIGPETADYVMVHLTVYNKDGEVIGTDETYAEPSTLKAGQKSTFEIFGDSDNFKGMDHYALSLDWLNHRDSAQGYVQDAELYEGDTDSTKSDLNGTPIAEVSIPRGSSEESSIDFEPATLNIVKGTIVKWINNDDALHTVTSGTPKGNKSGTIFDSGYLSSGNSYKHTFKNTGTFKYYDTLHTYMQGKIVVSSKQSNTLFETAEKETTVTIDTTPNTNVKVSNWSNFTDTENRFSIQYPSHWSITQSGNRFTQDLPLVAVDANGSSSKIQSQLSVNAFKSDKKFNSNSLAKYAYNQLVKESTGSKLVEPISCSKYTIGNEEACSFIYAGDDKEGNRYGILEVAFVDQNRLNQLISYRADPSNFDKEITTIEHIIQSYKINE